MKTLFARALCAASLTAFAAAPVVAQDPEQDPPPQEEARQAPSKASLAVLPFTYSREVLEREDDVLRLTVREFETTAFTNKLITALVQTRKFDVVERQRVDTLLDEMKMAESGLMDPARAVEAGRMIGADYVLMGEISVFTIDVEWSEIPHTSRLSRRVTAQIIVDMRIVDSRTSRIVAAEKGEVRHSARSMHEHRVATAIPAESIDQLQRDLCEVLTLKVIDAVYPVRIIGFTGGVVSLNRGRGGGLEVGMILEVFSEGEEMVDPDTGEILGLEEIQIGRVRVSEILPRFSKAEVIDASGPLPKGAVCRHPKEPVEEPAPPPARRGPRW